MAIFTIPLVYMSLIIGKEIGGYIRGYPGSGRETHEQIMRVLFGSSRKKK